MVHAFGGVFVFFGYWSCRFVYSNLDAGIHFESRVVDCLGCNEYRCALSHAFRLLSSYLNRWAGRMGQVLCPEIPEGRSLVSIRKLLSVILSEAKNLC